MSRQQFLFYFFAAAIVCTALYFFFPNEQQRSLDEFNAQTEASAYMYVTKSTHFDELGNVSYEMQSEKLRHFDTQDLTYLYKPFLNIPKTEGKDGWTMKSREGHVKGNSTTNEDTVELVGQVNIQSAHPKKTSTLIVTEKLTLYPDKQFAETDQEVTITNGLSQLKSIGMTIDMQNDRLEFLSEVRGKYETQRTTP